MANDIIRRGGEPPTKRGGLAVGGKPAKKSAKHAAKKAAKHVPKKHAKKAAKHVKRREDETAPLQRQSKHHPDLEKAFHHLHRAAAVISLIEQDSGGDLRMLLDQGIEFYSVASNLGRKGDADAARSALGLLRAAEHIAMAGLYLAREKYRPAIELSVILNDDDVEALQSRLSKVTAVTRGGYSGRAQSMGLELLKRSQGMGQDPHLVWELRTAVEGLCSALEAGL